MPGTTHANQARRWTVLKMISPVREGAVHTSWCHGHSHTQRKTERAIGLDPSIVVTPAFDSLPYQITGSGSRA